jgi:hypothetical protein
MQSGPCESKLWQVAEILMCAMGSCIKVVKQKNLVSY